MPRLLIIFLCLFSTAAISQRLTISAKVIDKETKEPLVFASVGIKDQSIGTITNLQGEFDFHFSSEFRNDILTISILGYRNFEAPVWTLLDKSDLVIELLKTTFILDEVVVKDSLSAGEVLRIALARIDQNYPSDPYIMDGFYRDLKKVGGTYISLLEAATRIYDENYEAPRNQRKLRERVALMEVRRSIGYGNKFTSYFEQSNLLEELLLQNSVKYRHFPDQDFFYDSLLRRDRNSSFNGNEIFVVGYHGDYDLTIYIDRTNYGIVHMEYSDNPNDRMRKNGMIGVYDYFKRTLDFRMYKGKLYPNYLKLDSRISWKDSKTQEVKIVTELFQELLINNIDVKPEGRIATSEKMKSYGLQYQDLPYNKDFWDNYNVIKESPLDKKIVQDLERLGPLEKQFQDN